MDYALAIRRNRDQLKDIVLALFALAGLSSPLRNAGGRRRARPVACPGQSLAERGGEGVIFPLFLPRSIVAAIMLVLRPAESAVRRLIMIAAMTMKPSPSPLWGGEGVGVASGSEPLENTPTRAFGATSPQGGGWVASYRAFQLFDPLKSFDPDSLWDPEPVYESGYNLTKSVTWHDASNDHTPIDATHLGQRLNALMRALNDLPRQARRLKRWELKRDAALKASKLTRLSPMRPGLPPGWRERKVHEIDDVLRECHGLANDRLNKPDTG